MVSLTAAYEMDDGFMTASGACVSADCALQDTAPLSLVRSYVSLTWTLYRKSLLIPSK